MNWSRYIKRTAVRRVVWIVVGLIVYAALSALGVAHAQTAPPSYNNQGTREDAWNSCVAFAAYSDALAPPGQGPYSCGPNPSNPTGNTYACGRTVNRNFPCYGQSLFGWVNECPVGATWDDEFKRCNDCASQPNFETNTNVSLSGPPAAYICRSSCEFLKKPDPPGLFCGMVEEGPNVGYWCNSEYSATGSMCTGGGDGTSPGNGAEPPPTDPDAPPRACGVGEVRLPNGECSPRGDCPLGQHKVGDECHPVGKCPAGHVKAPDGSCAPESCPANYVRGMDGTCKVDSNDDGTPDEDEPGGDGDNADGNKFSGGDSCSVPPACSGDAIMCGQARIQWRIDCNTRTASGATGGDHCDSFNMPICVGEHCDPVENKQMILQWRSMCALESLVNQEGDGEGDGGSAVIDIGAIGEGAVDGASGTIGDGGDPGEAFTDGSEGGGGDGELDNSGLGFGTSCPALPSINVLGVTLDFNEIGPELCDWMSLGGYIVLILSSLLSLRILAGGMNV